MASLVIFNIIPWVSRVTVVVYKSTAIYATFIISSTLLTLGAKETQGFFSLKRGVDLTFAGGMTRTRASMHRSRTGAFCFCDIWTTQRQAEMEIH